jgi:hypothetical protein
MKPQPILIALLCAAFINTVKAVEYTPTTKMGEFLTQFENAYKTGDQEWIQSAVDKDGVIDEAKRLFYGFLSPKKKGQPITNLKVIAAPADYKLPNTLIDIEIESTIPVDSIIQFTKMTGEFETTIKVPIGYRDGKIWFVGIKKK